MRTFERKHYVPFSVVAVLDLEITVAPNTASTLSALGLPPDWWPHTGMVDRAANQDGCQGASLRLDFTASGILVN